MLLTTGDFTADRSEVAHVPEDGKLQAHKPRTKNQNNEALYISQRFLAAKLYLLGSTCLF